MSFLSGSLGENISTQSPEPDIQYPIVDDNSDDPDYKYSGDESKLIADESDQITIKSENLDDELSSSSDEDPPERPTYQGSKRAYLQWTQRERQEVEALETLRARDLSLHLYNAFALKKRARILKEQRHSQQAHSSREDLTSTFAPGRKWTAWPLPPEMVPRVNEKLTNDEDEAWTIRGEPDPRPSAELEEHIIAYMTKMAKERFRSREWENDREVDRRLSRQSESDIRASVSIKEEELDDNVLSSPRHSRPVIQIDDDEIIPLLRPDARHIISRLDDLLLGLYNARQSYLTAADIDHPAIEFEDEGKPKLSINASRRARLGLRDWSDVLGIATMIGWPNDAVMRTAKRCADLFDQDMILRTMKEGKVQLEHAEDGSARWKYVEDSEDDETTPGPSTLSNYAIKPKSCFCPVEDCPRHKKGFSRTWNLNLHLKRVHPAIFKPPTSRKRKRVSKSQDSL